MSNRVVSSNEKIAIKVSGVTIIGNVILSGFKFIAGIIGNSGAMISDSVHSASDVLSTLIVIFGVKAANKESDSDHQYGHERMECVAALVLAVILAVTGVGIGYVGIKKIFTGGNEVIPIPAIIALIAAIVSIVSKEAMYWYTRAAAKKINSGALMADAWHHRSDAFSSIGSLIGILGARLGYPIMDPIASIVISFFIIKAAYDIFKDSIDKMTDKAIDENIVEEIRKTILGNSGVIGIDQLKTRLFGDRIYVDIEISADGNQTLNQSHDIAREIHDTVEKNFPAVKHCMIHVNPSNDK